MSATCCTHTKGLVLLVLFYLIFASFIADEQERQNDLEVFSISPTTGILEAREGDQPTTETLHISFTARYRYYNRTEILLVLPIKPRLGV